MFKTEKELSKMTVVEVGKYSNQLREKRNKLKKTNAKRKELEKQIDLADSFRPGFSGILYGLDYINPKTEQDFLCPGLKGLGKVTPEDIYNLITEKILNVIKNDKELAWQKPWETKNNTGLAATNFVSKKAYRGINSFLLNLIYPLIYKRVFKSPYFLTFKQVKQLGGKVKKGSDGIQVFYYTFIQKVDGKKVTEAEYDRNFIECSKGEVIRNGKNICEDLKSYAMIKYYNVFSADDIEGIDFTLPKINRPVTENDKIEVCENIVANYPSPKPKIISNDPDQAFYMPSKDVVNMPDINSFKNEQAYYSTFFHELVHSTGSQNRLAREKGGKFGDKKYAFEELIAELGASYLNAESGILYFNLNNSAAYLKSWKKALVTAMTDDNKFFMRAAAAAQKAADFMLQYDENFVPLYQRKNNIRSTTIKKSGRILNKKKEDRTTKNVDAPVKPGKAKAAPSELEIIKAFLKQFSGKAVMRKDIARFQARLKTVKPVKYKAEIKEIQKRVDEFIKEIGSRKGALVPESFKDNYYAKLSQLVKAPQQAQLFGGSDVAVTFISRYVALNGKKVTEKNVFDLLASLQKAIKEKLIRKNDPNAKTINHIQDQLVKLYSSMSGPVMVEIANIEKYQGLNGFVAAASAAVIGKIVEKGVEYLSKKKSGLSGIGCKCGIMGCSCEKELNKVDSPKPVDVEGFVRADQRTEVKAPGVFRLPGEMGKFIQDIQPYKYSIVITGDPHAGKTELVTQVIDAFAAAGKSIGFFSIEQGGMESKDTSEAIDRNVKPENQKLLHVTGEAKDGLNTIKKLADRFDVVVVDSFQKLNVPSPMFDSLRQEYPYTIWVVIFQQNGEGGTRGGVSADFDTPCAIKVHKVDTTFKNNYAEMKKNRGNSLNLKYSISKKKVSPLFSPEAPLKKTVPAMEKKYTTDNGSRCSGYGVYPDGRNCKGCSDCNGKFIKKGITNKEIKKVFDKTHSIIRVSKPAMEKSEVINHKGHNLTISKTPLGYHWKVEKNGRYAAIKGSVATRDIALTDGKEFIDKKRLLPARKNN